MAIVTGISVRKIEVLEGLDVVDGAGQEVAAAPPDRRRRHRGERQS